MIHLLETTDGWVVILDTEVYSRRYPAFTTYEHALAFARTLQDMYDLEIKRVP